jgi:hypothetical protein
MPGAPSGHIQSWSFQAPMYAHASGDTLISSARGVSQAIPWGRGSTHSRSTAVTSFHLTVW